MGGFAWLRVALALLCAGCNTQQSAAGPQEDCSRKTKFGDPLCCGRSDELPSISCIDLSDGGTIYGSFKHCGGQGEIHDARFVGAVCCEGLVEVALMTKTDDANEPGPPPGCRLDSLSARICSACGNGICDVVENSCNCAKDCPDLTK
jgi:hypothetical protein